MEKVVKLNAQTAGRDKVARLLQYLSRVIWSRLQKSNNPGANTFKNLEFQLSSFRKLLRFGKCIDTIYSIVPLLNYKDSTVKTTVILSRISNSVFLLADHILWLGRSDLCSVNTDKWSRICSQYWLYAIIMNLLRDFYEILKLVQLSKEVAHIQSKSTFSTVSTFSGQINRVVQKYPQLAVDVIKNACDIFLPLAALGYLNLSPSVLGTLGTVSSLAGLIALLSPTYKLSP